MRGLRVGVLVLLLLATSTFAAAWWLLHSTAGARWLLDRLDREGLLSAQGVDGSLWDGLALRTLHLVAGTVTLDADRVTLDWQVGALWSGEVHVFRLQAERIALGVAASTATSATPPSMPTNAPYAIAVDAFEAGALTISMPDAAPLELTQVAFAGSWRGAQVRVDRLRAGIPQIGDTQLSGSATLYGDHVHVDTLRLDGPADAQVAGDYSYTGDSALDLAWTRLRWPLDGEVQVASNRGRAHVDGRYDRYRAKVDADLQWRDVTLATELEGEGTLAGARLAKLHAAAPQGAIDGSADFTWTPQLQGEAHARIDALKPAAWVPALDGEFNGVVDAFARAGDQPDLVVSVGLRDSRWQGYPLNVEGEAHLIGGQWTVKALDARSGATRVQARGALWPRLDATAALRSDDLASLWPGLRGRAAIDARASGALRAPAFDLKLHAQDVGFNELSVARVDANGVYDGHSSAQVHAQAAKLDAGVALEQLTVDASGPLDGLTVQIAASSHEGEAQLSTRGRAQLQPPRWAGELIGGRIALRRFAPWTLEGPAALDFGERISLEPACWNSMGARACVRVLREGDAQRLAFRLESFAVKYLAPLLPTDTALDGTLDGTGQLDWSAQGIVGAELDVSSSALEWRQAGRPLLRFDPGRLHATGTEKGIAGELSLPIGRGGLRAQVTLGAAETQADRALAGGIDVQLGDLSILGALTPEITNVHGELHGHLDLGGTVGQPRPRGQVALTMSQMHLASANLDLSAVEAHVIGTEDGRLGVEATAQAGGGRINAKGDIDLFADPLRLDVALSGENLQIMDTPDARIWASPDLHVAYADRALRVTGRVVVPHAEITPQSLDQGVGPSPDQVIVRAGESESGEVAMHTEITLALGDQVHFEGFGLKTDLKGALDIVDESGSAARGRGEIQLAGGRYKAYGQDLTIETGRLIFDGGVLTDPALELRAQRKPNDDVTVGVYVRGRLDRPEFSLFSTPSMGQEQQLSWLVLGRPLQDSGGGADRAAVANAALALGLSGGDVVAQKLRGHLGLDEISIGAQGGEASNQAKLTIGKYLSPRFYISYGIGLFQRGHVFRLRYDIGRGFKLQTETGVQSGGDLLYSIDR